VLAAQWAELAAELAKSKGWAMLRRGDLYASSVVGGELRPPQEAIDTIARERNALFVEMGREPLPIDEAFTDYMDDVAYGPKFAHEPYAAGHTGLYAGEEATVADEPLTPGEIAREMLLHATYEDKRKLLARLGITVWVKQRQAGDPRTRRDLDKRWGQRVTIEVRPATPNGYGFRLDSAAPASEGDATSDSNRSMSALITSNEDCQNSGERISMPNSAASVAASAIPVRESSSSYLGTNENGGSSS
jgi:hypothetical protein